MPESLKKSEVDSQTDPSVAKQWDRETPVAEQVSDFYSFVDKQKFCILTTNRREVGPVGRAMGVAKRNGPDFLFIANKHSQKFKDLENSKTVQISFQDSSSRDWASITGTVTTTSNDDPRIKELYNPFVGAWFGDLGDGVHTGKAEDPRVAIIEVKTDYIAYWKSTTNAVTFFKEVALGAVTGNVATVGLTREFTDDDIKQMRHTTT